MKRVLEKKYRQVKDEAEVGDMLGEQCVGSSLRKGREKTQEKCDKNNEKE